MLRFCSCLIWPLSSLCLTLCSSGPSASSSSSYGGGSSYGSSYSGTSRSYGGYSGGMRSAPSVGFGVGSSVMPSFFLSPFGYGERALEAWGMQELGVWG